MGLRWTLGSCPFNGEGLHTVSRQIGSEIPRAIRIPRLLKSLTVIRFEEKNGTGWRRCILFSHELEGIILLWTASQLYLIQLQALLLILFRLEFRIEPANY